MTFRLVRELAADGVSVAVACRVLNVSRSGFYDWSTRPPSARSLADAELTTTILQVHAMSRCSYGAPRVHAELRLGLGIACGRKRVARLMRAAQVAGISHRRKRGRHRPAPAPHEDLVQRRFIAHARLGRRVLGLHTLGDRRPEPDPVLPPRHRRPSRLRDLASIRTNLLLPSPIGHRDTSTSRCCDDQLNPPSTRLGSSATGCAPPACSAPWAGSPRPWTTP